MENPITHEQEASIRAVRATVLIGLLLILLNALPLVLSHGSWIVKLIGCFGCLGCLYTQYSVVQKKALLHLLLNKRYGDVQKVIPLSDLTQDEQKLEHSSARHQQEAAAGFLTVGLILLFGGKWSGLMWLVPIPGVLLCLTLCVLFELRVLSRGNAQGLAIG